MRLFIIMFAAMFFAVAVQAAPVEVVVLQLGERGSALEYTVPEGKVLVIQRYSLSSIGSISAEIRMSVKKILPSEHPNGICIVSIDGKGTWGCTPTVKIPAGGAVWTKGGGSMGLVYILGFLVDQTDTDALIHL